MRDIIDCHDWIFSSEQFNQPNSLRAPRSWHYHQVTLSANQKPEFVKLTNQRSPLDIILTMSRSHFAHSESHRWENFHSFIENMIRIWFHVREPMSLSVWKSINFTPSCYWGGVKSGDKSGGWHLGSDWSMWPDPGLWLAERKLTRLPWFLDNLAGDWEGSRVNILYLWQLRETAGDIVTPSQGDHTPASSADLWYQTHSEKLPHHL